MGSPEGRKPYEPCWKQTPDGAFVIGPGGGLIPVRTTEELYFELDRQRGSERTGSKMSGSGVSRKS